MLRKHKRKRTRNEGVKCWYCKSSTRGCIKGATRLILLIMLMLSMQKEEKGQEALYGASNIQVLKGLEAVRKRPGMYIGSTGPRGLCHLVYEVVDNSIDESMAGFCNEITVELLPGDVARVSDNGRGIPIEEHPTEKISALELVLTRLHAGGKFDKKSYKVSGGLHGVGVSCVNALSESLTATVIRGGRKYQQKYKAGVPATKVQQIGDAANDEHGTIIEWKADPAIFTETTHYDAAVIKERLRELAFLNSGIVIHFIDKREGDATVNEDFQFKGGIAQFVKAYNEGRATIPAEPIYFCDTKDDVVTEIAMQYNNSYNEVIPCFVNDINTRDGGTHLDGFKNALTFVLNKIFENNEKLHKSFPKDERLTGEDVRSGLVAVISMKVPEPEFEGQTKEKLGNSNVRTIVDQITKERLTIYFEQNPKVLEAILLKASNEAKARIAARKAKEGARKKTLLDGFGLPEKLSDCSVKDPASTEIYIVEGDSAGGSAKKGRDSKTQAILPLWGKMLNVEKVGSDKVVGNEKLEPIIASLGCGFADTFDITKLRYGKIIIMADADVDGSHIRTLLLTFFFRYMKALITDGHVYLAMPPLFKVQLGKKDPVYVYTEEEREAALKALGASRDKASVQRYKGLGEMSGEQLWETTMNRENRRMKLVTLEDAARADNIFAICMGTEVEPRRKFIEENAVYAKLDV